MALYVRRQCVDNAYAVSNLSQIGHDSHRYAATELASDVVKDNFYNQLLDMV